MAACAQTAQPFTEPDLQAMESRLDRITNPLLRDNATLCPKTGRNDETQIAYCDYPVFLVESAEINGHTDGDSLFITAGLMQAVADDINIALIFAHELAHALAGHVELPESKALELRADQMALVLMARAGYDIDRAIAYWERAELRSIPDGNDSESHPGVRERLDSFQDARARIRRAQAAQKTLDFTVLD